MSDVALALIEAVQAAGASLTLDGHNLQLEAPMPLSELLRSSLRQHKPALVAFLADQAANANAEPPVSAPPEPLPPCEPGPWSAGIPDDVARGIGAMVVATGARDIPGRVWPTIVADTLALVDSGLAAQAFTLGWSTADLFGCDRQVSWRRIDRAGLMLLAGGREISELTTTHAALCHRDGTVLRYRRPPQPLKPPVAMLWHLLPRHLRPHVGPAP